MIAWLQDNVGLRLLGAACSKAGRRRLAVGDWPWYVRVAWWVDWLLLELPGDIMGWTRMEGRLYSWLGVAVTFTLCTWIVPVTEALLVVWGMVTAAACYGEWSWMRGYRDRSDEGETE